MKKEMEQFEVAFKEALSSDVVPLDEVLGYVAGVKGKRLRPTLVFLSARLFGEVNESTRRTALFVELLHTATLIHDDVVDSAGMRRGQPSVNARWDNKTAVLAGDYLLSRAMMCLSHPDDNKILREMLHVAMTMTEGELLQSGKMNGVSPHRPKGGKAERGKYYLDVIERKTARLIRACCVGGALSVTTHLSPPTSHLISAFGLNLGLVFQMRDDILDDDSPENTAMAKQLLPEYLEKTLKALEGLAPYAHDEEALASLRALAVFCAERNS